MRAETKLKKLKVAVIHPAVGKTTGGSQIFALEVSDRLKNYCDVTVFSAERLNSMCEKVFSIQRGTISHNILHKTILKTLRVFCSKPDIVLEHISSFFPLFPKLLFRNYDVIFPCNDLGGLLVAFIIRAIKGTPVIFTEHNGYMEKGKIASRNLKFKPDLYITLSRELECWVNEKYPDIKTKYIPNGVDFYKFNPDIAPSKINLSRPIALTASRNQPNKRLDLVIEAVSRLKGVSLVILSQGNNLEELYNKGKKLLDERFLLLSANYDEMPGYYRACDIFTLPSEYEPFGLVYLEAMASNKPVVAPDDPSRREIIADAGILCSVEDPDTYSKAIKRALEIDFGNKPLIQAQKYSWENSALEYYKAVQTLAIEAQGSNRTRKTES